MPTILLADDSITIRKVVELTFCDTDLRVESVGTGSEALKRFEELRPDLVLADVVMPEPSGYEICRAVKASKRPVPVLLLAGTFEPFDPARARECGCDGHLVKPFDSKSLVDRVALLLDRRPTPRAEIVPAAPPAEVQVERHLESMLEDLRTASAGEDLPEEPAAPPSVVPAATEILPERPQADPPRPAPVPEDAVVSDEVIDRIARRVVERLSDKILREIAWDVVPDLAEIAVRERLRELEREES